MQIIYLHTHDELCKCTSHTCIFHQNVPIKFSINIYNNFHFNYICLYRKKKPPDPFEKPQYKANIHTHMLLNLKRQRHQQQQLICIIPRPSSASSCALYAILTSSAHNKTYQTEGKMSFVLLNPLYLALQLSSVHAALLSLHTKHTHTLTHIYLCRHNI